MCLSGATCLPADCCSGATCLPADCCISNLALNKSIKVSWSNTKWASYLTHRNAPCSHLDISKNLLTWS